MNRDDINLLRESIVTLERVADTTMKLSENPVIIYDGEVVKSSYDFREVLSNFYFDSPIQNSFYSLCKEVSYDVLNECGDLGNLTFAVAVELLKRNLRHRCYSHELQTIKPFDLKHPMFELVGQGSYLDADYHKAIRQIGPYSTSAYIEDKSLPDPEFVPMEAASFDNMTAHISNLDKNIPRVFAEPLIIPVQNPNFERISNTINKYLKYCLQTDTVMIFVADTHSKELEKYIEVCKNNKLPVMFITFSNRNREHFYFEEFLNTIDLTLHSDQVEPKFSYHERNKEDANCYHPAEVSPCSVNVYAKHIEFVYNESHLFHHLEWLNSDYMDSIILRLERRSCDPELSVYDLQSVYARLGRIYRSHLLIKASRTFNKSFRDVCKEIDLKLVAESNRFYSPVNVNLSLLSLPEQSVELDVVDAIMAIYKRTKFPTIRTSEYSLNMFRDKILSFAKTISEISFYVKS